MRTIFYGAGSWLARNLNRLRHAGYEPVCVCDADSAKHHQSFGRDKNLLVLPLESALKLYPDLKVYVTVDHSSRGAILRWLTTAGQIPESRILNWAPLEYRRGCSDLETTIKFRTQRVFVRCYWRHPGIERTGDMPTDIRRFAEWRTDMLSRIRQGQSTPCDGCDHLKPGWYLAQNQLTSLQVSESNDYSFCNFNCCYCFNRARDKAVNRAALPEKDEQLDVLRYVSENFKGQTLELQFSTGELTVHPHRDEILEHFKNYETVLFTNAAIYNEKIAALMRAGLLTIIVSMDAGTGATFHKIKGVACFNKVCANLEKYAHTGGCVILKYIMLPGVNDNVEDINGFLDLARQLGAVVQLSNDTRTRCQKLPEPATQIVCHLAKAAKADNLLVIHEKEVFSAADNALIQEALNGN